MCEEGQKGFEFQCQRGTRVGGQQVCDGVGGGVRAVADGEGIVDVDLGVRAEGGGEGGIVLFFAWVEA